VVAVGACGVVAEDELLRPVLHEGVVLRLLKTHEHVLHRVLAITSLPLRPLLLAQGLLPLPHPFGVELALQL
jgi:hypothetical protein